MALDSFQSVKSRAILLKASYQSALQAYEKAQEHVTQTSENLADLKKEYAVQVEAIETLKGIIEQLSREHLDKITRLLTYGLQTIFPDRDYSVEIEVDDKRGSNTASFWLLEQIDGEVLRSPLDGGTGGSIRAVIGFILQIFYIKYFHLSPVLFMDEAFGSISERYIPYLVEFMRQLADKRNFIFALITHDSRIIPLADRTYRVEEGGIVQEIFSSSLTN
jgi:DNA repair exonuclease SbcCD ATPase subunit